MYALVIKLDKIDANTQTIKDMSQTLNRIDERTLAVKGENHGTTRLQLPNLGEVRLSAGLGENSTAYSIEITVPILRLDLINGFTKSTGFSEVERKFFGKETTANVILPTRMIWTVPSSDPKVCTEFIALAVKWLDSQYFELANGAVRSFEDIKL